MPTLDPEELAQLLPAETAAFAQSQILSQAAIAALSYANRQRAEQLAYLLDEVV